MGYEFTMHKMENFYWKLFWIILQKYTQNATKLLNLELNGLRDVELIKDVE